MTWRRAFQDVAGTEPVARPNAEGSPRVQERRRYDSPTGLVAGPLRPEHRHQSSEEIMRRAS